MSILDTIKAYKLQEVALSKTTMPIFELEQNNSFNRIPLSISGSILDGSGVIAEFKRASPSKGNINKSARVEEVVKQYEKAGASAISVLTDKKFFKAKDNDLQLARENVDIPILRKEFIVDEYQVVESKTMGADAILLIAAILSKQQILNFTSAAHRLGLEVLIEVHHEAELDKLCGQEDMVGINNRNLNDFTVDLNTSIELVKHLQGYKVKISESGIHNVDDIVQLKHSGFDGFLIGEHFMKSADPMLALHEIITQMSSNE